MFRKRYFASLAAGISILLIVGCAPRSSGGKEPNVVPEDGGEGEDTTQEGPPDRAGVPPGFPGGPQGGKPGDPKPYDQVITEEAVTKEGLFKTHQIGPKLYFEIPAAELGKEMMIMTRAVEGSGGGGRRIVQWERRENRILLRAKSYAVVADSTAAIWRRVSGMRKGVIIAALNIESYGPDSAAVVEVTSLYTRANPSMGGLRGVQPNLSWIEHVVPFENNIEVEATQTGQGGGGGILSIPGLPGGGGPQLTTVRLHWSMLKLPEDPMMPRYEDDRVGFISSGWVDYSSPKHGSDQRSLIHRFRLEKKDPNAAVSDPVEPIVYWIDAATPEWLKPYVKQGVEDWQPAFEDAGFSNAIFGRYAPTKEEDPDFSIYDARHSAIYWRPSTIANATGGQTVDPRTGQIIKGEVNMYHNVMELVQNWYFTQVGPLDSRAGSLPLPNDLMGRLVQYVVAHEIGHSIGFPHNMKASAMYPADSVRSASFLQRMGGHVATLMDYSRFNYVAQPEDNIPVELLTPGVGPYDYFAVMWGYKPIPGAKTPEEELQTLDEWARMQDTIPWFRFTTSDATADPNAITEAVGDEDAVKSSSLGLKNLQRVMDMMLGVGETPGKDYSLLEVLYGEAVTQWGRYMGHVAAIVGGHQSQEKYGTGPRFDPETTKRQKDAVAFLNERAFKTPDMLINSDILRRIEPEGALRRIGTQQGRVISTLLNNRRMNRLIEYEALAPKPGDAYGITELLADLRKGIWGELSNGRVRIDVYRRNLHRAYLDAVDSELNPPPPPPPPAGIPIQFLLQVSRWESDARAALRAELEELDRRITRAINRAGNAMTRIHLRDMKREIGRILDPED